MNDRGLLASYLLSPLSKITNPENTTQFKLVKDHNSDRVNASLIKNKIPITLFNNMLYRQRIRIERRAFKMITNKNYNVDLASLQVKKIMYEVAKEMNFD